MFMLPGEGLKANTTLEELYLSGNAVGDDGARHLMMALKENTSLQFLGLQVRGEQGGRGGKRAGSDQRMGRWMWQGWGGLHC